MAGDPPEAAQLKGLSKTFNSVTIQGRANVRRATVCFMNYELLPVATDCFFSCRLLKLHMQLLVD